jgi:hypothetical protein
MKRLAIIVLLLAGASGCGGEETTTVEVTTTVDSTTTVEVTTTVAGPTKATTEESGAASGAGAGTTDPDDVSGSLDLKTVEGEREDDLLRLRLETYGPWAPTVLRGRGSSIVKPGPNRMTVSYDTDLDGKPNYRGKVIFAGGSLSIVITGVGQAFEPVPVERTGGSEARFTHPLDVFFLDVGGPRDIQVAIRSEFEGAKDRAPDSGWLLLPAP